MSLEAGALIPSFRSLCTSYRSCLSLSFDFFCGNLQATLAVANSRSIGERVNSLFV